MKKTKINIFVIIMIIMIIIGILFIYCGIFLENIKIPNYNYRVEKSDNYEVLLKPNDFYMTNTLPSGGYYASKSVKSYKIDFKYILKGNKKSNINYNYNITATMVGTVNTTEGEEKEVWKKESELFVSNENNNKNTDELIIEDGVEIDYDYYNDLARSYEKTYGITIDSILKIRFNISYLIDFQKLNDKSNQIEDFIELDIPITNTVTEVKENYEKSLVKEIDCKNDKIQLYKKIIIIIGVIFIICGIILLVIIKNRNDNKKTLEEKYEDKLKHILKYYKDIIVNITNLPEFKDLKIINVSIMEDLVDIAEQTRNNILYYKNQNKDESNFYVVTNTYIYRYILLKTNKT